MSFLSFLIIFIGQIYLPNPTQLISELIYRLPLTQIQNDDIYFSPPQVIHRNGYPVETYHIQTPDGFILGLHRIPGGKCQKNGHHCPVLLIHGYIDSSYTWIANGPEEGLGYLLADEGYDVWLFNQRGNTFSRSHVKYSPSEQQFWNFSCHEVGIYDLPTTIDFILSKTDHEQLICIASSAGNPESFIMLSELLEYNDKIMTLISLAPFYYDNSPRIPVINTVLNEFLNYLYKTTTGSFLEHDLLMQVLLQIGLLVPFFDYNLFEVFLSVAFGWFPSHIHKEIIPALSKNIPAGTSIKQTLHMTQLFGSFRHFDCGPEENLQVYGTITPPKYNLKNVRVPVRIYYGQSDTIAKPEQAPKLYKKLPAKAGLKMVPDPKFSHLDFTWNKHAKELLYDDVIAYANGFLTNSSSSTI